MSILGEKDLQFDFNFDQVTLIKVDSYDEKLLLEKLLNLDVQKLLACILQIAIIGFGNKSYGTVKFEGKIFDVKDIFSRNSIIVNAIKDSSLRPDDLTPRRLLRLFRYQIRDYIKVKGVIPYLYRKYLYKKDIPIEYCFPCAEHIIPLEFKNNFLDLYHNVDMINETDINHKVSRVFNAREFIEKM